ncbi:shikimate dehydrogenase family protein [Salinimicrobium sp. GXAS 041]|uniref:shikimate dehydrogenase family protein n=1 Tax=Salinimicrobium sp. GXAS 041 TaxID=3400806 RepID=UPI003C76F690
MRKFGLLGKDISYSFSRTYFKKKFQNLDIDATYDNFDVPKVDDFKLLLEKNEELEGLNVTIPYKEQIIPFLDTIHPIASEIGAVNTIKISKNGQLAGYNTDYFGFTESIKPFLKKQHTKALILGTGGASKAVAYSLKSMGISSVYVSRKPSKNAISYAQLSEEILKDYTVIINCTPLGTSPKTAEFPAIPVEHLTPQHLVYDLIYNPAETRLMKFASEKGATTTNGLRMLELQAERAWEIWNHS